MATPAAPQARPEDIAPKVNTKLAVVVSLSARQRIATGVIPEGRSPIRAGMNRETAWRRHAYKMHPEARPIQCTVL